MEDVFLTLNKEYSAILVTGPRQVGKTTMLQRLMAKDNRQREYVSLDDLNERALAKKDPAMFFQLHKPPIFIDEVQYAPELFPYIKIHIDKYHKPGDFWLTGSQVFKLMEGIQESLAGRIALLRLFPLSQQEIFAPGKAAPFTLNIERLKNRQKHNKPVFSTDIFNRIFNGGMPALISGKYSNKNRFYSDYIATYLERDVKNISGTINSLKFMNFITSVAARTSQLINYKSISDNCDIDQSTAKNWLQILEKLGIVFTLHPYSNNILKRTIKTPKIYFYDTGLVCSLTKWSNGKTLMTGAMDGAILENYVVSEILKSYYNAGIEPALYYYRDKDSKEIDIILESDGYIYPMEIKKSVIPETQITRVFNTIDKGPLKRGTGAVLCMAEKLGAFDSQNLIVPISLI